MDFSKSASQSISKNYGYASQVAHIDGLQKRWDAKLEQPWSRPFEVILPDTSQKKTQDGMTPADARRFTEVSRKAFQYIARRHSLNPIQMWDMVSAALLLVGMHHDDLDDVQELLFGWKDLNAEMLERYRWRYPDRCPLLDALCTMDASYDELNGLQDWILEIKGSKERRRLDLLPALPDPDGIRPEAWKGLDFVKYYVELHS